MKERQRLMNDYLRLNRIAQISGKKRDYEAAKTAHREYQQALMKEQANDNNHS